MVSRRPKPRVFTEQLVPRSAEISTKTFSTDYLTRPSENLVQAFLEHVRKTGQPETFPTICTTKPIALSVPVFLCRFDIDRKKRPNWDEAPCSICSPNAPKFLHEGYFVWYPDEGVIRAIGPECGDTIFGGNLYAQAKEAFDKEERERQAVAFLERNYLKLPAMLAALQAIRTAAVEAFAIHVQFKKEAPRIHKMLRQIKNAGGSLRVSIVVQREEVEDEDRIEGPRGFGKAESDYDSYDEILGQLPLSVALQAEFDPLVDLNEIIFLLSQMPQIHTEDEAFVWICDTAENIENLEAACVLMRGAAALYVRLVDRLDSFASFFSEDVFAALNTWGQHPENAVILKAYRDQDGFHLAQHVGFRRHERICLAPDLARLRTRGSWPGFAI